MIDCKTCDGSGEELEWCCKTWAIAYASHCPCGGNPQFKADCRDCNGTGLKKEE